MLGNNLSTPLPRASSVRKTVGATEFKAKWFSLNQEMRDDGEPSKMAPSFRYRLASVIM